MATLAAKMAGARQLLQAILLSAMVALPQLIGADAPANKAKPLPKELVEYVREARRLGLPEQELKDNARKAGWPATQIGQAIADTSAPAAAEAPAPTTGPTSAAPASESGAPGVPAPPVREPRPETRIPGPDDYRIGAGDVLQISVWDEPKASVGSTVVRPDGRIGMPLLKEVDVMGLSPQQAEARITQRLSALIPNADVTVVVSATHSKKIYAIGAVKKEGPISYTYRMSILQALSEAGGLNDYAKHKKIYILRTENGKEYRFPFDYDAVLKGQRVELNITLLPNDVIVVPR